MTGDTTPRRVQLSRAKGWRKPENTVVVARPQRWGNPYTVQAVRARGPFVVWLGEWFNGDLEKADAVLEAMAYSTIPEWEHVDAVPTTLGHTRAPRHADTDDPV